MSKRMAPSSSTHRASIGATADSTTAGTAPMHSVKPAAQYVDDMVDE